MGVKGVVGIVGHQIMAVTHGVRDAIASNGVSCGGKFVCMMPALLA